MSPICILVVDDESAVRRVVCRCIRAASPHFQVLEARDGVEALQVLSATVALVVTDIAMPRMDGLQLCRAIRSMTGPERDVPVVLLSSMSDDADHEAGLDAGATLHLAKPVDQDALDAALRKILGCLPSSDLTGATGGERRPARRLVTG